MKNVKKYLVYYIIALACTLILTSNLKAATLAISSESGSPGEKDIPIPINLSSESGEQACSFNFDLNFDTSRVSFKEVTLGSVPVDAGKSLSYSKPNPHTVRVVVIGLNENVIGDGKVLTFTFDILDSALSGKAKLSITNPSISNPKGELLPAKTDGAELHVFR